MDREQEKSTALPRLRSVDALRGVAALFVLLFHSPGLPGPLVVLKPIAAMGWSGVGLFLVLSGFSIHFRWAASDVPHHAFSVGRFARRRFFRLYPTYIAATIAAVLVGVAVGDGVHFRSQWVVARGEQAAALGLVAQAVVVFANMFPTAYLGVSWSLGLEVQLYAMYALLIRRLRAIGVVRVLGWSLGIALIWRLGSELVTTSMPGGQFFPDGHSTLLSRVLYAQLPSRAFEWLLGVLAAEWYFGRVKLPKITRRPVVAAIIILVAAGIFRHPLGAAIANGHPFMLSDVALDPFLGCGYFVLLVSAIRRDAGLFAHRLTAPLMRGLAAVGIFSYSLYLTHETTITIAARVLRDSPVPAPIEIVIYWVAAIAAAWVFYQAIERHFVGAAADRWISRRWPFTSVRARLGVVAATTTGSGYTETTKPPGAEESLRDDPPAC